MNSKYKIPKEMIAKILKQKGEISMEEAMSIIEPYMTIDIEKLREQELSRYAKRLMIAYKKKHDL